MEDRSCYEDKKHPTPLSVLLMCLRLDRLMFGIILAIWHIAANGTSTIAQALGIDYENNHRN